MVKREVIKKYSPDLENLLLILTDIQNCSKENYIRDKDMVWIAEYLNISLSMVYGVVTYYSMFSTKPRGNYVIRLCCSPVCGMMGAGAVAKNFESILKIQEGQVSGDKMFSFEKVECLGQCEKAPAMMVNDGVYGNLTLQKVETIISFLQKKL